MKVYTGRVSYQGPDRLDITVKNNPNHILAPTWSMVLDHKQGLISDAEYTDQYIELVMRTRGFTRLKELKAVLSMDQVTLVCFCRPEKFCHRHLAAKIIETGCRTYHIPVTLMGER